MTAVQYDQKTAFHVNVPRDDETDNNGRAQERLNRVAYEVAGIFNLYLCFTFVLSWAY